jgi:hypothetical protein
MAHIGLSNRSKITGNGVPTQATPIFLPVGGTYNSAQSVTITSANADAIYYTVDGSTPTIASTMYTGAITVSVSETVKAVAVKSGFFNSAVGSAAYTLQQATPTFLPVAGSYSGTQSVAITSSGADAIYYTTDGSTPTTGSTLYTGPVSVASSLTLMALAVKAGWTNSAIGSAAYVITAPLTPEKVQFVSNSNDGATITVNLTGTVAGNDIIVTLMTVNDDDGTNGVVSVVDSVNGAYTHVSNTFQRQSAPQFSTVDQWHFHNGAGGDITITATFIFSDTGSNIYAYEVSNLAGSVASSGGTSDTSADVSSISEDITAGSEAFYVAAAVCHGDNPLTGTVNSPWTADEGSNSRMVASLISSGNQTVTFGVNADPASNAGVNYAAFDAA